MTSTAVRNVVRHVIRDERGTACAVHVRRYEPDGSKVGPWWEQPDGTRGLNGIARVALPLYGAEHSPSWDLAQPVIVTEGEMAADALLTLGYQAVGTVTGAGGCPSDESLSVLSGRNVILWPDADEAGAVHMLAVYPRLWRARSVAWVAWASPPKGGADAADADAETIRSLIALAAPLGVPTRVEEQPQQADTHDAVPAGSDGPWQRFNASVGVCAVLVAEFGIPEDESQPGRTLLCIGHDEHHPSMSILPDNRRVYCHKAGCPINNEGRGRDAYDLWLIGEAVRRG